jgi:hypothetical protein
LKKRLMLGLLAGGLMATMLPGAAMAGHEHFLVTPGTCVENIARGQTAQTDGGGFHRFHVNVHTGQPGGPGGPLRRDGVAPVIVDKTVGGNPLNLADCEAALE